MSTPTLAPVIATLNMKGGVGKTTVTANVLREFYRRREKRVLLIDFDPQFNLTQTVMTRQQYAKVLAAGRTIMSVMEPPDEVSLFKVCEEMGPPPKPDDVLVTLKKLQSRPEIDLSLVPGNFGLVKYSLINQEKHLSAARKRFLQFVTNCRIQFDLVCIDCNPSSSFMTLCAIKAASHLLIPVRPDRYSILGLELLSQFILGLPDLPQPPKKLILLNGVPTSRYDPTVENELRAHAEFGPVTLTSYLHTSKLLEAKPGTTGFATDRRAPNKVQVRKRINSVADEIAKHLGM